MIKSNRYRNVEKLRFKKMREKLNFPKITCKYQAMFFKCLVIMILEMVDLYIITPTLQTIKTFFGAKLRKNWNCPSA